MPLVTLLRMICCWARGATFAQSNNNYRKYMNYKMVSPYFEDHWKVSRRPHRLRRLAFPV